MSEARRFAPLHAAAWSVTWAVGAAIGVALGAYLTVVGAQATPGDVALDTTELVLLPLVAAAVVFAVSFIGRLLVFVVSRALSSDHGGQSEGGEDHE